MGKKIRKFLTGILAVTMAIGMSVTAFAASATVYYVNDATNTAVQQPLTAAAVYDAWYYGDTVAQNYLMIVDYQGADGYEYLAYYAVNDKANTYDFALCNVYEGCFTEDANGVYYYKGLTDVIDGVPFYNLVMKPANATTDTVTIGTTALNMSVIDGASAVSYLAAMQAGVPEIQ